MELRSTFQIFTLLSVGLVTSTTYPRDELEIFSHVPHTGGRAFSDHINMAHRQSEVVNGSQYGGWISPEDWKAQRKDCSARLAFGHNSPSELRRWGITCPHHFITLLRSSRDFSFSLLKRTRAVRCHVDNACRIRRAAPQDSAWCLSLARGGPPPILPTRAGKPSGPMRPLEQVCAPLAESQRRTHQVTFLAESLHSSTLPSETTAESQAIRALSAIPFFGLLHHWTGSLCLWHHVTGRPWLEECDSACSSDDKPIRPTFGHEAWPRFIQGSSGQQTAHPEARPACVCPPRVVDARLRTAEGVHVVRQLEVRSCRRRFIRQAGRHRQAPRGSPTHAPTHART